MTSDPEQVERLWFWRTSDVGPVEWIRSTSDPGPSSRPDYECIEVVPASALEASEEREERLEAKCRKRARIITDLEARVRELQEQRDSYERGGQFAAEAFSKCKAERDQALARARELEEGQLIQVTALHKAKAERDEALTALRELVEAVDGTAAGLWPEIRPALREARSLLDSTEESK